MVSAGPTDTAWREVARADDAPKLTPYLAWALDHGEPATGDAPDALVNVSTPWLRDAVERSLGTALRDWAKIIRHILPAHSLGTVQPARPGKNTGRLPQEQNKAIIGIIDDGIAFAHERFRLGTSISRVQYLWLQDAQHSNKAGDIGFGREYNNREINRMMRRHRAGRDGALLDEESLYRDMGALDMSQGQFQSLALQAGHGTAVLDLASGFTPNSERRDRTFQSLPDRMGIDPETYDLALVTLPQSVTADTSGTYVEMFILAAMIRLFDHAEAQCIATKTDHPIVINISFGLSAGPKDGTSLLDRFIDAVTEARGPARAPVRIVIPAGNHGMARCHARLETPMGPDTAPLYWSLLPDDPTPNFLEIWSAPMTRRPDRLPWSITLRPPNEPVDIALPRADMDTTHELAQDKQLQCRTHVNWHPNGNQGGRVCVTIVTPPTVPSRSAGNFTAPGNWRLSITGEEGSDNGFPIDLSIQRDDMVPGFRSGGRQSHFTDAAFRDRTEGGHWISSDPSRGPLPHIRRSGTLNALATARDTVVVGGCYAETLERVRYSGQGSADIRLPDVTAPSSVRRGRGNISAAGTRSGSRIGVEGTSVAAPTMTREMAKALRPAQERPKLSGVSLLRRSMSAEDVPAVLPIAEDLQETAAPWTVSLKVAPN